MINKKKLKQSFCNIPLLNDLITKRSIDIHKKKITIVEEKLKEFGINMVSPKDFRYINPRNYTHCNIWGSGYSAAESSLNEKLTSNSFDIGFGYSYILKRDFNFYFLENASPVFSEIVQTQKKGIKEFVNLQTCKLVFKNIWQDKNDINYAINEYKNLALFSKDLIVPHYLAKKRIFKNATRYLLEKDDIFFRQSCSRFHGI